MNGALPDFGADGRNPCLFSYVRQLVHSTRLSLPPWCQSLEAVTRKTALATSFTNCLKAAFTCCFKPKTHSLCHSDRSSCFPVHCPRYQDHHHWQNLHPLHKQTSKQTKNSSDQDKVQLTAQKYNFSSIRQTWEHLSEENYLNNFETGRSKEKLRSEFLLCERTAACAVVCTLWFLRPPAFSSSGNRK